MTISAGSPKMEITGTRHKKRGNLRGAEKIGGSKKRVGGVDRGRVAQLYCDHKTLSHKIIARRLDLYRGTG